VQLGNGCWSGPGLSERIPGLAVVHSIG
jgi:hypothetical protein